MVRKFKSVGGKYGPPKKDDGKKKEDLKGKDDDKERRRGEEKDDRRKRDDKENGRDDRRRHSKDRDEDREDRRKDRDEDRDDRRKDRDEDRDEKRRDRDDEKEDRRRDKDEERDDRRRDKGEEDEDRHGRRRRDKDEDRKDRSSDRSKDREDRRRDRDEEKDESKEEEEEDRHGRRRRDEEEEDKDDKYERRGSRDREGHSRRRRSRDDSEGRRHDEGSERRYSYDKDYEAKINGRNGEEDDEFEDERKDKYSNVLEEFMKVSDTRKESGKGKKNSGRRSTSKKARQEIISLVTMNTNGPSMNGITPRFKLRLIRDTIINSTPDVIFIQDSIDVEDMKNLLEETSSDGYDSFFQEVIEEEEEDEDDDYERSDSAREHERRKRDDRVRSQTGIAWNNSKYTGTPLALDDDRMGEHVQWLRKHDLSIVRLDSVVDDESGTIPFFVAISWHGYGYNVPLRQRNKACKEFFEFLCLLREKNSRIPILIGGDFNMDMKSFNMKKYPDFALVPYRPVSGTLAKDFKNTFLFTMDSLRVTETSCKQHYPEVFSSPFVTVQMKGISQDSRSRDEE